MSKYESKLYADFDHFLRYMENSLNRGTAPPVNIGDYSKNGTRICIRRFDAVGPVRTMILMGKTGRCEVSAEIYESGVFLNKGMLDSDSTAFRNKMERIFELYNPLAGEKENNFSRQRMKIRQSAKSENNSPEIPEFSDRIKKLFR